MVGAWVDRSHCQRACQAAPLPPNPFRFLPVAVSRPRRCWVGPCPLCMQEYWQEDLSHGFCVSRSQSRAVAGLVRHILQHTPGWEVAALPAAWEAAGVPGGREGAPDTLGGSAEVEQRQAPASRL